MQAPFHLSALHQYACVRCRFRKIKCDKVTAGCAKCIGDGAQCTYSARRPRKSQKAYQESTIGKPLLPAKRGADEMRAGCISRLSHETSDDDYEALIPQELSGPSFEARFDSKQLYQGRLFRAQGKSRYINSDKANQVASLEMVLAAEVDAKEKVKDEEMSPLHRLSASENKRAISSFLLSTSNTKQSLRAYHPTSQIMGVLWHYYVDNVDILIKVLYKPSVEALIIRTSKSLDGIDAPTEVLLFAIWFATITTMSTEECLRLCKEERDTIHHRYRYALEQALAQAGWMTSQEVTVLQALILLIVFTPGQDARSSWTLSGIAMGLAQAMGMHRDSTRFSLSTVETEVRRRIWWTLCQLDNRISEDCGLEPHVPLSMDTKLPLHIDDSDLDSGHAEAISSKNVSTEMTVSLIKIEMAQTSLKAKRLQYGDHHLIKDGVETLAREQIRRYEDVYLKYLDKTSPFHRLCYLGTRLLIAKLWKMSYDASKNENDADPDETKDRLISYHADVLEIAHQLPAKSRQHGWFIGCKYRQWHAMAHLLVDLCQPARGPAVDRAWSVLDTVFGKIDDHGRDDTTGLAIKATQNRKSPMWEPLLKLLEQARSARSHAQEAHRSRGDVYPVIDSEFVTSIASPVKQYSQMAMHPEDSVKEPLSASKGDFGDRMSHDDLDKWIESYLDQQDTMDYQADYLIGTVSWW